MNGVRSMEADGEMCVGTVLTFHTRGADRHAEIAEMEPGRRLVLRSTQGSITADYTYTLENIGDNETCIRLLVACDVRGLMRPIAPLIRFAIRKADQGQLDNFSAFILA